MNDLDRDRLDRILPPMSGAADWDDVLDRAKAGHRHRSRRFPLWRVVAAAAAILVGGLLVTPAVGIGDRLLTLIESAPARPDVQSPVWSPDGRRIAFLSRPDGNKALYVMNADGSGQRRLTRDASNSATPAWSPDGRTLAFESVRNGINGVYAVNADGSGQRRLARSGHAPAWSPDGRTIAFFSGPPIYLMNADGSEHRTLAKPCPGGRKDRLRGRPTGGSSPSSAIEVASSTASSNRVERRQRTA